jgi:hypothetical protein
MAVKIKYVNMQSMNGVASQLFLLFIFFLLSLSYCLTALFPFGYRSLVVVLRVGWMTVFTVFGFLGFF